jgi:(E)-4-hydroxy-3-methylbut-2-enyl-diphosphate synthase
VVKVVPEHAMVAELVKLADVLVRDGVDAALAAADPTAAAEAERDRAALLADQGEDANASEQRVELIRRI